MKQEAWRFTSVAPIAEGSFELAKEPARIPTLDEIRPFLLLEAGYRLVFVDGFFQRSLSTPFFDDVQSLAHVVSHRQDLVRQHLGKYVATQDRPFSALNTAFVSDGAFVHVPAKTNIPEPIQLLFLASGTKPVVAHPRNLVVIEREARLPSSRPTPHWAITATGRMRSPRSSSVTGPALIIIAFNGKAIVRIMSPPRSRTRGAIAR